MFSFIILPKLFFSPSNRNNSTGSIDVFWVLALEANVAGGGMDITDPETLTDSTEVYLHTLGLFERAAEVFGIEPQVLQPVFGSHHRYATLHTQERRLVVMPVHRPQMFLPPQVLPVLGRAVEVRQALQTLLSRALPPEKPGS